MAAHLYRAATDSAGNLLLGATVTICNPGTTTAITDQLYTDQALTIPIANPFVTATGVVSVYLAAPKTVTMLLAFGSKTSQADYLNALPNAENLLSTVTPVAIPTTGAGVPAAGMMPFMTDSVTLSFVDPSVALGAALPTALATTVQLVQQPVTGAQQRQARLNIAAGAPMLRRFRAALENRANEPCDILFIGDSLPSGQAQTALAKTYPQKFLAALRTKFPTSGVTGGLGNVGSSPNVYAGATTFTDIPVATVGTPSTFPVQGKGIDASSCVLVTSGDKIVFSFTGDGFDLNVLLQGASAGSYTVWVDGTQYQWNGGASGTNNLSPGTTVFTTSIGANFNVVWGLRGLSVAAHTVEVRWTFGLPTINGLFAYNGDATKGIRLTTACVSGQGTNTFWGTGGGASYADWIHLNIGKTYFPDLVVIDLGGDDFAGSFVSTVAATTTKTNLQGIIADIKAGIAARTDGGLLYKPSFLFTIMHNVDRPIGTVTTAGGTVQDLWATFRQNYLDIASTDPDHVVDILDIGTRIGYGGFVTGTDVADGLLASTDFIHFNDIGASWMANTLASFVSP